MWQALFLYKQTAQWLKHTVTTRQEKQKICVDSATAWCNGPGSPWFILSLFIDEWLINTNRINILDSEYLLLVAGSGHSYKHNNVYDF